MPVDLELKKEEMEGKGLSLALGARGSMTWDIVGFNVFVEWPEVGLPTPEYKPSVMWVGGIIPRDQMAGLEPPEGESSLHMIWGLRRMVSKSKFQESAIQVRSQHLGTLKWPNIDDAPTDVELLRGVTGRNPGNKKTSGAFTSFKAGSPSVLSSLRGWSSTEVVDESETADFDRDILGKKNAELMGAVQALRELQKKVEDDLDDVIQEILHQIEA